MWLNHVLKIRHSNPIKRRTIIIYPALSFLSATPER